VAALSGHSGATDPATVIGPAFAETCGNPDDLFAFMTGSKMFMAAIKAVEEYLKQVCLL
jgi:hypothetical protein